jgi:hypothetical protein
VTAPWGLLWAGMDRCLGESLFLTEVGEHVFQEGYYMFKIEMRAVREIS